ncbi:MAG: orotate phosphoribosyltransferase-like protein [Candidatus Bathyarchaeia archaeon]
MSSFDKFLKKAHELKSQGLSDKEIAEELNIQIDTVTWLLLHEKERAKAPAPLDFSVNWASVGSNTKRVSLVGWALADLAREAVSKGDFDDFDVVVGIEISGSPLGLIVADDLEKPFAAVRATRPEKSSETASAVSSSFSAIDGKRLLLVTDVISTGAILQDVVKSVKETRAKPVGMVCLVDKRGGGALEGVPVRPLISLIQIKR